MKRVENHGNLQQMGLKQLWFKGVEHEIKTGEMTVWSKLDNWAHIC